MNLKLACYILFVILLCLNSLSAQDPYFTHFFNAESIFNPALVGYRGATSICLKYKTQWDLENTGRTVPPYETLYLSYEESMPCSILDYGLNIAIDKEGEGILQTMQLGGQVAGTIPLGGDKIISNIRVGGGVQWGQKRIDYDRLIFSDQLDPKFGLVDAAGNPLSTNFVPPNAGESLWYFAPSLGFSYRALFVNRKDRNRSSSLHLAAAMHNIFGIGNSNYVGNIESILGIGTILPMKYSLMATYEMIPFTQQGNYLSVKPSVFYQLQDNIDAITAGVRLGLNKIAALGVYINFNESQQNATNTNWLTITGEIGTIINNGTRVDLGLAYSASFSGLRNDFGPIFEISAVYHIGKSTVCGWMNLDNDLTQGSIKCPTATLTAARDKLYEGIWYKTNGN